MISENAIGKEGEPRNADTVGDSEERMFLTADSFESMEARLQLLEGIAKGEKAIQEGRVLNHSEAKRRMSRWLD